MSDFTRFSAESRAARLLHHLYLAMVEAANPARVLPPHLPEDRSSPLRVIGAGKAAAAMAAALDQHWTGPVKGFVVTPHGHAMPAGRIAVREAAHPLPDEAALDAGQALLGSAREASRAGERMLCLLSGGASSLACVPPPGVSLAEKRALVAALLRSGADIAEINCVRKHMSMLKGGRLAVAAWPSPVLCLAISDVPGDDPAVIGSGPLSPDPSTRDDALLVLERHRVDVQPSLRHWFADARAESPKPGQATFSHVDYRIIATPSSALAGAVAAARALGLEVMDLGAGLGGDAVALGRRHAGLALERLEAGWKGLILSGGETGVTVSGSGRGGRNSAYLAGVASGLDGAAGVAGLAADTDGIDGTGGAGAWFDPGTLAAARERDLPVESFIRTSDTHGFFATLGSVLPACPTRTNVNDFRAILVGAGLV